MVVTARPVRARVVWLAVADARGHLMRAQLMRALMARTGVDVDIVTTSAEGARFLQSFGAPSAVLSRHFRVVYDERQNLARARTEVRSLAYLLSPRRCLRDVGWLERRARGAALVVNDSFHPALLAPALARGRLTRRLVQVYGENLRRAVEGHFGEGGLYAAGVRAALDHSFARIEHTLADEAGGDRTAIRLPPVIAAPRLARDAARAELGIPLGARLAVVYLNPHFRAPPVAAAIEDALHAAGYSLHAVGEGYAGRPGWHPSDARLADAVAAADVLVSAAGMATLAQARVYGVPLVALATGQPEQRANLALLRGASGVRCRAVEVGADLRPRLAQALATLPTGEPRPDPGVAARRIQERWVTTLLRLIEGKEEA